MLALNNYFTGKQIKGNSKKFDLVVSCFTTRYKHILSVYNLVLLLPAAV